MEIRLVSGKLKVSNHEKNTDAFDPNNIVIFLRFIAFILKK